MAIPIEDVAGFVADDVDREPLDIESALNGATHVRIAKLPDLRQFKLTDSGNAERLVEWAGNDLRYVPLWNKWLSWDGSRWVLDSRAGSAQRAAKAMLREFQRQAIGIGPMLKFALASESKKLRQAMVELAQHEQEVIANHDDFDADPMLLNVENGTIDLRTGKLRPHRRQDLITKIAPVAYDEAAECPRFDRFLGEIMAGDLELVYFLLVFLGYCLTGDVREHVLAFWWGKGGNGKGVLAELLLRMLGSYAGMAAPDLLFRTDKTERHPAELADLHGLRLVFCNETKRGRAWDEARVKDVSGGDRIKARRMREDFWEFAPTHKLIVYGNHKPQIRTVDDGIRRRLRLVPFVVSFVGREDRELAQALLAETPGILRKLVDGCVYWHQHGLPRAAAVTASTESYLADEDTLGQFFREACVLRPDARVTRKDLQDAYEAFAEERGEKPVNAKAFAQAVRELDGVTERRIKKNKRAERGWAGIELRPDDEATTDSLYERAGGAP